MEPKPPEELILTWAGPAFVAVTLLNAGVFRWRANRDLQEHPERAEVYRKLIRGFILWSGGPWILLCLLVAVGGLRSLTDLFATEKPAAVVWQLSVLLVNLATVYWVFARGGAETLSRHPAMLQRPTSPAMIKFWTVLMNAGALIFLVAVWSGLVPVPSAR